MHTGSPTPLGPAPLPVRKTPKAGSRFHRGAKPAALSTHVPKFRDYLEAECGMAANTVAAYLRDVTKFAAWLPAGTPPTGVVLDTLTDFVEYLTGTGGLAPTSTARHLVSLKQFFRYLILEGVLAENAADLLVAPKLWDRLPAVLSPEKVNALLAAPHHSDPYPLRDRAVLAGLYATGCRASEVTGLCLRDVNTAEGWAKVTGKGDKQRVVGLNPVAVAALAAYLRHERPHLTRGRDRLDRDDAPLFLSRTGRPLTRVTVWNLVKRCAGRAGCSDRVSPHTLRHSFATHMLAGGAELRALQELLGHASIRTTQVYTHVEHSRLKRVHALHHPRG